MINNRFNSQEEKIFFTPGDICTLRLDIPHKPKMLVCRIERSIMKRNDGNDLLKGIKCRWFTENGFLLEAIFSTKDLIKI